MAFSLIETMRWEPETGILRARLHRARLVNSARKLGLARSDAAWNAVFEEANGLARTSRLRLELFMDGSFEITATAFAPQSADTVWTVRIATSVRLDSTQPLLRHKTSARDVYEAARAEYSGQEADDVLLLNEKDEICEGAITNLFVEASDGTLLTPPLSSGCLAGVLRTSLLCDKKARVSRIVTDDLAHRTFYMGNSLRGLIAAKLAG